MIRFLVLAGLIATLGCEKVKQSIVVDTLAKPNDASTVVDTCEEDQSTDEVCNEE